MENTQYWEEGRITIHIDTKTFDFEVFHYPDLEEFEECYEIKIEDLPTLEFPIKNIKFEQIDKVLELVKKHKKLLMVLLKMLMEQFMVLFGRRNK